MSRTFLEPVAPAQEDSAATALGRSLREEFDRAEKSRRLVEERWLASARQYAGQYEPDVLATIPQDPRTKKYLKSTVFIRQTKAKCDVLKARLMDLLFPSNNARNWSVGASPRPEVPEFALVQEMEERNRKGEMIPQDIDLLTREVADKRARAMSVLIEDQLNSSKIPYKTACASVMRSGIMYGAGVLKGPLVTYKPKKKYFLNPQSQQWETKTEGDDFQPYFEYVPVFDLYPDPAAARPEQLDFIWQTHVMTRSEVVDLIRNPGFRGDAIKTYLANHREGDVQQKAHEIELRSISQDEMQLSGDDLKGRFRLLERWGHLSGAQLLEAGMTMEELQALFPDFDPEAVYGNNLWIADDGTVIKCSIAPVEDLAVPYHFFIPYADDTGFWGESLPDIVRDPQVVINAAARMTLDNAAISCGPQLAVNVSALAAEEDPTRMHSGKVWLFETTKDMSECIREIGASSHIQELLTIGEKYSQFADETTIPRYMSGDNSGVRGAGDTASGLSMLMSMASMPVKDMVIAFDTGITEPFIRAMYRWNMRYSNHDEAKGDYEVVATGSTSLIAQELMGKRLLEAMAVLTTPGMAEQTDFETLYTTILRSFDLPAEIQLSHEAVQFRKQEQMKMEKIAQLEALLGEVEKRNLPVAPEIMKMIQQVIAGEMSGGQPMMGGAGAPV